MKCGNVIFDSEKDDWKYQTSVFDEKIDEWLPNMFKNAERVSLSGVGEALASKHTRNVMKKIVNLNF